MRYVETGILVTNGYLNVVHGLSSMSIVQHMLKLEYSPTIDHRLSNYRLMSTPKKKQKQYKTDSVEQYSQ